MANNQLSATQLAEANAQGMTPAEYSATYESSPQPKSSKGSSEGSKKTTDEPPGPDQREPALGPPAGVAAPPKPATPESAYEQLANAQADQYLQMEAKLQPLTSGATLPATESNMSQGAEAMLGQSATSPMAQWLNAQNSAAQAQNAPVEAANQAVSTAETQGQGLVASGIQQMGQAETATLQAAPYSQLLSALAADVPYKLFDNYNIKGLPSTPGVAQIEGNLGITAEAGPTSATGGAPTLPPIAGSPTSTAATTPESTTASLTQ